MFTLSREVNLDILDLVECYEKKLYDIIYDGDIEKDEFGACWTGSIDGYLDEFIESLGIKLGIDLSLNTTRSIEDILHYVKTNNNIHNIEELEEVDTWRDSDSEPKYVYINSIMKYKPTGDNYHFIEQRSGDNTLGIYCEGKVERCISIRKEIKTFSWKLI